MKLGSPRERGLTGDGILVLLIGTAIVAACGWLAWSYGESTEKGAQHFADETLERLTVGHDGAYLARHLGPNARFRFDAARRRYAISSLTKLGVPTQPGKMEGAVTLGSEPGKQIPQGHFHAHLPYPAAQADLYLEIARRDGRWQIDELVLYWTDKPPAAVAQPSL